ncbi:hypothetical protein [Thalassobacillus sp. C254]|uniref:hypothetical protein n=1 Tax=Thalassobacillus sp. C254 TaxID=1225341 RepID=UPI0006D0FF46|nr:hypothetical protein [Thalassobacillus sp. C254]
MKKNLVPLSNKHRKKQLEDVIQKHDDHIQETGLVVRLLDGTCTVTLNPQNEKYEVFCEPFDLSLPSTLDEFLTPK